MIHPTWSARLLSLALALLPITALSQTAPAVTVTARGERRVALAVPSADRTYTGDYKVDVYLPPDYAAGAGRYRVLYLFDGNDVHKEHDDLLADGLIYPAILVAIQNRSAPARFFDLTPSPDRTYQAPTGGLEAFGKLIVSRIKPYIDANFRTLPDAAHTGVSGNSLGGLAACYLGYTEPQVFGMAACMEPSLWWNNDELLKRMQHDSSPKTATRFWIMGADRDDVHMWQNAKRGAVALLGRGWREGEDVAFLQIHNLPHGWESAKTQLRDMLHFLLRKSSPRLLRAELTNCQGPQHQAIRLRETGESANVYLDLTYEYGLRATAIAPVLQVADPKVATLADPVLGQLYPVGPGWTTVSAVWRGLRASIEVQGFRLDGYERLPIAEARTKISVDGDLADWGDLPYEKTDGEGGSAGFRFGVSYDEDYLYIACRLKDDVWIARPGLGDPIDQHGLQIRIDARPDPIRALGRGQEAWRDFLTVEMAPGETVASTRLRRGNGDGYTLPQGLTAATLRTPTGYAAEVAIPASALDQAQGGPWKEFRLNICQYDRRDANGPVRRVCWQPDWASDDNAIGSGTFSKSATSQPASRVGP
jgi:predicted alpha/beta superfamily hydrolase